MVIQVAR